MENKEKLLLTVLTSVLLILFLFSVLYSAPVSKDSKNPEILKTGIEMEPVYDMEYSNVEIRPK